MHIKLTPTETINDLFVKGASVWVRAVSIDTFAQDGDITLVSFRGDNKPAKHLEGVVVQVEESASHIEMSMEAYRQSRLL